MTAPTFEWSLNICEVQIPACFFLEKDLFASIAQTMVLKKEELTDRFRKYLWKQSLNPHQSGEQMLIAELLLEDEKEALELDKTLELEDIGKVNYTSY